jgi:hypothetical protein
MRFFRAGPKASWPVAAFGNRLQELYAVPQDLPDEFAKIFARLDGAERDPKTRPQRSTGQRTTIPVNFVQSRRRVRNA